SNTYVDLRDAITEGVTEIAKRRDDGGAETYFRDRLRALRKKLGLSQQEFAKEFGLSFTNIRNWEQKGRGNPNEVSQNYIKMIEVDPDTVRDLITKVKMRDLENV
ncbi:helix-turn-helix domain-containing protein, partial [Breoghania sp. JC706]|uniref:helix-turn-helix domain-containing protein n=1 Tax=Breoghania sp. JC706 TaxID=3117732 RepID=UPI00300A4B56